MKNLSVSLVLLFGLLINGWVFGQSMSPEVIGTAGTHQSNATAQVTWTVGEVMTETASNGTSVTTQGFHQTNVLVLAMEQPGQDFQVEVYPNPVSSQLNISFHGTLRSSVQLVDMHGHVLLEDAPLRAQQRSLDVTGLSDGNYILTVSGETSGQLRHFKIQVIKSN